ncbi:hypothetical protein ES702_00122 [subsurface metagenome]
MGSEIIATLGEKHPVEVDSMNRGGNSDCRGGRELRPHTSLVENMDEVVYIQSAGRIRTDLPRTSLTIAYGE